MSQAVTPAEPRPLLVGDGPATFSTCTALDRRGTWVWDAHRYYADLGVATSASRAQIRAGYAAGPGTARRTFLAKQLLNRTVRRSYDLTPLGEVFYDRYVDAAWRRAQILASAGQVLDLISPDVPAESGLSDLLDNAPISEDTSTGKSSNASPDPWRYAHYLWGTEAVDPERLRTWQDLLVRALGQDKKIWHLAVGLTGDHQHPVQVVSVGFRTVAFLRHDQRPTDALAQQVASLLHTDPTHPTAQTGST